MLLLLLASAVLNLEGDPQPVEFLIVLSVNTRDPMPVEVVDWSLLAWANYNIIKRATSKAPVTCAAAPDARKESHSYFCQSEILLLGSGKVTAE